MGEGDRQEKALKEPLEHPLPSPPPPKDVAGMLLVCDGLSLPSLELLE